MDPVTALGLVAGILQVVDFSVKALGKCRELHKDGSLAEHRNTKEIAKYLGKYYEIQAFSLACKLRLILAHS